MAEEEIRTPLADLDPRRALPSGLGTTPGPQENLSTVDPPWLAFAQFFRFPRALAWRGLSGAAPLQGSSAEEHVQHYQRRDAPHQTLRNPGRRRALTLGRVA